MPFSSFFNLYTSSLMCFSLCSARSCSTIFLAAWLNLLSMSFLSVHSSFLHESKSGVPLGTYNIYIYIPILPLYIMASLSNVRCCGLICLKVFVPEIHVLLKRLHRVGYKYPILSFERVQI